MGRAVTPPLPLPPNPNSSAASPLNVTQLINSGADHHVARSSVSKYNSFRTFHEPKPVGIGSAIMHCASAATALEPFSSLFEVHHHLPCCLTNVSTNGVNVASTASVCKAPGPTAKPMIKSATAARAPSEQTLEGRSIWFTASRIGGSSFCHLERRKSRKCTPQARKRIHTTRARKKIHKTLNKITTLLRVFRFFLTHHVERCVAAHNEFWIVMATI